MASYPMTEAALMESVPDAVRGRVFGIFVMGGGVIGNLSHWAVGAQVKQLAPAADSASAYFPIYPAIALLALLSLTGLLAPSRHPAAPGTRGTHRHRHTSMPLLT